MAFEKVSGKDLNWFFNQWYFGNGHIKLNVTYDYNTINKTVTVNLNQQGKVFNFPISIDIYDETGKKRHDVWIDKVQNSFKFPYTKQPKLIVIDPKHVLLAEISDKKSLEDYIFQFNKAPHFLDRKIALEEIVKHQQTNKEAQNAVIKAFNDPYYKIRITALDNIDLFQKYNKKEAIYKIENIAQNDKSTLVQASAIGVLGKLVDPIYKPLFERGINNVSFAITGSSLSSLYQLDKVSSINKINLLDKDTKENLADAITTIYINEKDKTNLPFIANQILKGMFLSEDPKIQQLYNEAFKWISESDNKEAIENVTNSFVKLGLQYKKYNFDKMAINMLNQMVQKQLISSNENKDELILLLKTGMAKLIE